MIVLVLENDHGDDSLYCDLNRPTPSHGLYVTEMSRQWPIVRVESAIHAS